MRKAVQSVDLHLQKILIRIRGRLKNENENEIVTMECGQNGKNSAFSQQYSLIFSLALQQSLSCRLKIHTIIKSCDIINLVA